MKILGMEREEKASLERRIETCGLPQSTVASELSSQVSSYRDAFLQSDGLFAAVQLFTNIFIEHLLCAEYICLNIPHSLLLLCIALTSLQIWNIFSLTYLISIQSSRLVSIVSSSMKNDHAYLKSFLSSKGVLEPAQID